MKKEFDKFKQWLSLNYSDGLLDLNPPATNDEINERIAVFDMKLSDITLEEILKMKHKKIILDEEPPIDEYILNNQKYLHFNPKPRIFDPATLNHT